MSEIIRPEQYAVTPHLDAGGGGIMALAQMSNEEFEWKLALLKSGRERITRIHLELMEKGSDYDAISGTGTKPTLLQPGAEKLCQFYGLAPKYDSSAHFGDGINSPDITVTTICRLHAGSQHGPVIGESVGVCTSWEKKYRYRRGERFCPACNGAGTIIKGREEYGGGWVCFKNKGGCGAKFLITDPTITQQVTTDVPNPDPFELLNTITKMSEKRALVGACKFCTATSHLYTQDVEDLVGYLGSQVREQDPPRHEAEPPREKARSQAPRNPQRTGAPSRSTAPESNNGAATNGKCPECKASKGHSPTCSVGKGQTPAPAAPVTPEPAPTPSPEPAKPSNEVTRLAALEQFRMHWASCDGPADEAEQKRICGELLTQILGEPTKVLSIVQMPEEWLNVLNDHLFEFGITPGAGPG